MTSLPDFLSEQTEDKILKRMLDKIPADLDKNEGGYIWDALSPSAAELYQGYIKAQETLRRGFVATTFEEYLDLRAAEDGVERRLAVPAVGTLKIWGSPGTSFASGLLVGTPADFTTNTPSIEFKTTNSVTLNAEGIGIVDIEAIVPGKLGIVPAGSISILSIPVTGITKISNEIPTYGGLDEEDDDSLRTRILEKSRQEEGYGNIADYIRWAKEVPGVGNVMVEPLWQGEGTVKVVVLDMDGRNASNEIIEAVQKYIDPGRRGIGEGKAPIGARVTVVTAKIRKILVTIPGLIIEPGYTLEQARTNVEKKIKNYLDGINPGGVIRIKEAETEIINAQGIQDVGDILINGARNNISLAIDELADLGSVNYVNR